MMHLSFNSLFPFYYENARETFEHERRLTDAVISIYEGALSYVERSDVEDLNTRSLVKRTIRILEDWLTQKENARSLRRHRLVEPVEKSLAIWYAKPYTPQGPERIANRENYATRIENSEAEQVEASLHDYFITQKALGIDNRKILQEIRKRQPIEANVSIINHAAPTIAIAQTFFQAADPAPSNHNPEAQPPGPKP